ncbi:MAG TPA: cytochrome ubiquinol oxidase subunit I [Actinospica sp.]|nr:cytochrome ubiquinol oxidase subunit I [Actinospica sp.]
MTPATEAKGWTRLDALLLARWQFGLTAAVHHFLFVPLTIGLALLTVILQTVWLRTGQERHLRATRFWGGLFLISFVLGVATGIVREFQFGMAWNGGYSSVGGDLGAPPAIEGLLGFFVESTVVGLWVLGWDRLPRALHTACGWTAACGAALSAYPALTEDGPTRHPVGHPRDGVGRQVARLAVARAMHGDSTALAAFAHTMIAASLASGLLLVLVSSWHLRRGRHRDTMLPSLRLGLCASSIGGIGFGWILTETGARPWAIGDLPETKITNMPAGSAGGGMWTSLIVLTLLYVLLGVVEVVLMVRAARRGPDDPNADIGATEGGAAEPHLGFAY